MSALPPTPVSFAWQLAFAALANAKRLLGASHLLHEGGYFGPAMSMAISAREEQGKFFKVIQAVLESQGAGEVRLSLGSHPKKQALGMLLAQMQDIVDWSVLGINMTDTPCSSIDDLLEAVGEHLIVGTASVELKE